MAWLKVPDFKRYGIRLNLDNNPRPWLTIGTNLNFNQTNENLTQPTMEMLKALLLQMH